MIANIQRTWRPGMVLAALVMFLSAATPGIVGADCVSAPPDIVSWWCGDGNPTDIVGGYEGTPYFDVTYAPGKVGQAFSFDGLEDVIWAYDTHSINGLDVFTIEAWVFIDNLSPGRTQRFVTITGEKAVLRYDGLNGPGQLHFYIRKSDDVWQDIRVNDILAAGAWYHVAGTYDGSVMKAYLGGEEIGSLTTSGASTLWPGSAVELSSEIEALDGLLDEVSIYSRALTEAEILSIYEAGSDGKCKPDIDISPLVCDFGYVEMDDEGEATVVISNEGGRELIISDIDFQPGGSTDFEVFAPALPVTIGAGENDELEIIYTPSELELASAVIEITTNDPDEPVVEVALEGAGLVFVINEKETPVGKAVIVKLVDERTGKTKATIEYEEVLEEGMTKLVIRKPKPGEKLPDKHKLGDPAELLELETTAKIAGEIKVSIDYSDARYDGSKKKLRIYHKPKDGDEWKDITLAVDMLEEEVIAKTDSFSTFGIFELDALGLIDGLINDVLSLGLQPGIESSLVAKLSAALLAVNDPNASNDIAAIGALEAFIAAVEAQSGNKIPAEDADNLIATALEIILALSIE